MSTSSPLPMSGERGAPVGYDQENIDAVHKAGVLDSDLDAMALGLEDDEKKNLNKKIQDSIREEEPAGESVQNDEPAPRSAQRRAPEPRQRQTLWQRIVAFFKSLFSGFSSEKIAQRKAVKESEDIILRFKPQIFDSRDRLVKKDLILFLDNIESRVRDFGDFFNANFNVSSDDVIRERLPSFSRFIVENMLTMDQLSRLRTMRELDLEHSFKMRGEEATQRDLEVQVKQFEDSFNRETVSRIEGHLEIFVAIINLKNYNFHALFNLFRKEGADENSKLYRDFQLEHAVSHLRNLDSYLSGIPFRKLQEEHKQWFERFAVYCSEKGFTDLDFSLERFQELLQPLRKLCEKKIVTHLVRVGLSDPLYKPKPVVNTISYVKKYKALVSGAVRDHVQKRIMELRENQVTREIEELFEGGRPYVPLALAGRDVSSRMESAGVRPLANAFVFNLVYSYLHDIYMDKFRKSVNAIVVEGEFRKKEMGQEFSNTYYGLGELYEKAKGLVTEVDETSPLYASIMKLTSGHMDNPIAIRKLDNDVSVVDEALKDIGHAIGSGLMVMYRLMENILRDFKGLRVVDLINAKTIGGVANRSLLFNYDKLVASLKKLEAILSRFMVIAGSVE